MSLIKRNPQINVSHVFATNDCSLTDVINELGSTHFFNLETLNLEHGLSFRFKYDSAQNQNQNQDLTSTRVESNSAENSDASLLTVIGELTWRHLQELWEQLREVDPKVQFRLVKPTAALAGALQFRLATSALDSISNALQQKFNADSLELVTCRESGIPSLTQPGLLVMDMDSTAIQIECIDEIAKLAGVGEQVAQVTAKAMRGELDFEQSLHARVATLKDADADIIEQIANNLPLMPGLKDLVIALKSNNWRIAIVSGGFTAMTEKLKSQLNLDRTYANVLDVKDGRLLGTVSGRVIDAQAKADSVEQLAEEFDIPMIQTVAMGDGANDLKMMSVAQLGVAFHAKPLVQVEADVSFVNGGLNQLLYLLDQKAKV